MLVHLLVHECVPNDSIKGGTWGGTLCCTWDAPNISFREFIKSIKSEEKDEFDVAVDG